MAETDPLPAHERDFVQFIIHGAASVTPADVHALVRRLPELRDRFQKVDAPGFPRAPEQLSFLADVVESFAAGGCPALPYVAAAEAAFALLYLQRDVDVIPDFVPKIGFVDDAAVASTVLARHATEFSDYAAQKGTNWEQIDPAREET